MNLKIGYLYPDILSLYGDRGNVLCMEKRLQWRGIGCEVMGIPVGAQVAFGDFDLFFIGGGQDFDQEVLLGDLNAGKAAELRAAAEDGKTFLCVCGGYQMMGNYYETAPGHKLEFIGAVDMYTVGSNERLIGNFAFELGGESGGGTVVGFENHAGRTYLGSGVSPLGKIIRGFGNNGVDGTEGARYKNIFGTYSHGPVLPKNPSLCDSILACALTRKYGSAGLEPLPDVSESEAHDAALTSLLKRR